MLPVGRPTGKTDHGRRLHPPQFRAPTARSSGRIRASRRADVNQLMPNTSVHPPPFSFKAGSRGIDSTPSAHMPSDTADTPASAHGTNTSPQAVPMHSPPRIHVAPPLSSQHTICAAQQQKSRNQHSTAEPNRVTPKVGIKDQRRRSSSPVHFGHHRFAKITTSVLLPRACRLHNRGIAHDLGRRRRNRPGQRHQQREPGVARSK